MSLPGTTVVERQSSPSRSAPVEAGTWFIAGMSERGPIDAPVLIRNLQQFIRIFGGRVAYGTLYDAVDTFFREGGSRLYVARVAGPTPTKASATLSDGTNPTATVKAKYVGDYGADLNIEITHPTGSTIKAIIKTDSGTVLESSPEVADVAGLVAWSASASQYVDVIDLAHNDPVAASTALTGGTDDHANATDATWLAALDLFTADLGPGQVSMPGRTTANAHAALLSHAENNNRIALLDLADTATVATLTSAAATDRALNNWHGGAFAPWAIVPGIAPGTTRTVPYSAIEAGILARNDAGGKSPNIAAAGINGISRYAIGLSQPAWSESDRETLNDAGVNVALIKNGSVTTYGYRTLIDGLVDDKWLQLSNARLFMVISALADQIAESFVFAEIDGKGVVFSRLNGALTGMLLPFYSAGSLYGETFEEAAFVDTGIQVNTPETIADLQINAVIEVRMSPYGERVRIEISKTKTTEVI